MIMKRCVALLTAVLLVWLMAGCAAQTPVTSPPPTPTPTLMPTLAPEPEVTDSAAAPENTLEIDASLDVTPPPSVRNIAVKIAVLQNQDALADYVFGQDIKNTNVSEDSWDDNGVVTVTERMWEMKNPDDTRWLYLLSTGNIDFDRQVGMPKTSADVTVDQARGILVNLLTKLGLPTELGVGTPSPLPEGMTLAEAGLYPEFDFSLKDIEGIPISNDCVLTAIMSTDGENVMSLSACLIESERPVGNPLTLIPASQAVDTITKTLADNPDIGDVSIDSVRLAYDMRRVRGMPDTGLLIPVWEFQGPDGDLFAVDAVTGTMLGGFSDEVVAEPAEVQ